MMLSEVRFTGSKLVQGSALTAASDKVHNGYPGGVLAPVVRYFDLYSNIRKSGAQDDVVRQYVQREIAPNEPNSRIFHIGGARRLVVHGDDVDTLQTELDTARDTVQAKYPTGIIGAVVKYFAGPIISIEESEARQEVLKQWAEKADKVDLQA